MKKHPNRRHKLIPQPRLQILCTLSLCSAAFAALIFHSILVHFAMRTVAASHPELGASWANELYSSLWKTLGVASLLFIPATFFLGTLLTFRLAGPIYRFKIYLRAVADGIEKNPCHIRDDDELHELCELINEVTEPLRQCEEQTDELSVSLASLDAPLAGKSRMIA